ncbi:hypothetical protein [uncultured Thermanaerothrix sp.]|uniref:hypothetical protein n=1 Tax=uncultured Thermanaerothrix sp. TaxID=1195149 RepID=UPI002620F993|nr:hypothetical protein [uncultured Thermanaerothrix sp.]
MSLAVEANSIAYVEPGAFIELMKLVNWAFIEHMNPAKHKAGTGVSNDNPDCF